MSEQKKSRGGWIFILIAVVVIIVIVTTQQKESIKWNDYKNGIELAKQQNKPILLSFMKSDVQFCIQTKRDTYTSDKVIKFVADNFIPIQVDVDKNRDLANQYQINYYPTHIIKFVDDDNIRTAMGYDPPGLFIKKLQRALDNINQSANKTN